jgi:hypothetical protein
MNKKGDTSILETINGLLIGLGVAAITIATFVFIFNAGTPEFDSVKDLAKKVREVNLQQPGAMGVVTYFQDEESLFYPINEKSRNFHVQHSQGLLSGELDVILTHTKRKPDCENNNCICLCQEFDEDNTKRCETGSLYCEKLDGVTFSPGTGKFFSRKFPSILPTIFIPDDNLPPASQRVRVIKCRGGEEYCKNSKKGDISIIFDWLDQRGEYNSIK